MSKRSLESYLADRYPIELVYDEDGRGFFAEHPDLERCFAQGQTANKAVEALARARAVWIRSRYEDGLPMPEPRGESAGGRFLVRASSMLHARLVRLAAREGVSLNQLACQVLALHVGAQECRNELKDQWPKLLRDAMATPLRRRRAK